MVLKPSNQTTKQPNNRAKSFQSSVFGVPCRSMRRGFTLLELLVSISIIGILVGVGAVSYTTAQKKSRDAKRKGDMKQIQNALEQCYSLEASYPTVAWTTGSLTCDSQTIATTFPQDPKNSGDYKYQYNYYDTTNGSGYCVCALLEQESGNVTAKPTSYDTCSFGSGSNYFCVQNLQ